jgi:putative redox protein
MPSAVARQREGYETEIEIREHRLTVDEPQDKGGADQGPAPTELLAASLASCTAITLLMYAGRKEWDLGGIEVAVDFKEGSSGTPASFDVRIKLGNEAELSDEQREKLLVIAGKCPVHRALASNDVDIADALEPLNS